MTDDSRENRPKGRQSGEQSGNGVVLDSETRQHLARMLKATYDEVASEPIPDRFRDLLNQLDAAEPREK